MTIQRAIATLIVCTLLLAALGTTIGYGIGRFAPAYYRTVFRASREPRFDPVQVGVGQGLSQGTVGGVIVGLAVVALFCWRDTRLQEKIRPQSLPHDLTPTSRSKTKWLLLTSVSVLVLGFCLTGGLAIGTLMGEMQTYHRRYLEERDVVAPVLAADPAFAGVEIHEFSAGGLILMGEVPTSADLNRLHGVVIRAIGESRAKDAMHGVDARK